MRMLASLSRVDQTRIRTGQLDDEDWARISGTIWAHSAGETQYVY